MLILGKLKLKLKYYKYNHQALIEYSNSLRIIVHLWTGKSYSFKLKYYKISYGGYCYSEDIHFCHNFAMMRIVNNNRIYQMLLINLIDPLQSKLVNLLFYASPDTLAPYFNSGDNDGHFDPKTLKIYSDKSLQRKNSPYSQHSVYEEIDTSRVMIMGFDLPINKVKYCVGTDVLLQTSTAVDVNIIFGLE